LIKNPDVILREEPEQIFLFNSKAGKLAIINSTGLKIWNLCNGRNSQDDITKLILKEYQEIPLDEIKKTSVDFIKEMIEQKYLLYK